MNYLRPTEMYLWNDKMVQGASRTLFLAAVAAEFRTYLAGVKVQQNIKNIEVYLKHKFYQPYFDAITNGRYTVASADYG